MKKAILIGLMVLGTFAQAQTHCVVLKESQPGSMEFTQPVYRTELKGNILLVEQGHEQFQEVRDFKFKDLTQYQGRKVIALSEETGVVSILIGEIPQNAMSPEEMKFDSVAYGVLGDIGQYVGTIAPERDLSVNCSKY